MSTIAADRLSARENVLFTDYREAQFRRTSRIFTWLMGVQWVGCVLAAVLISPTTWIGTTQSIHLHLWIAMLMGGALCALPVAMIWSRPEWWLTRHVVGISQVLFSALLIHITGGRIETHFHVFGSLAFLSMYRDWKVVVSATVVVALDHMLRGLFAPLSVFGSATAEWWRWLEHAGWVVFEDIVLIGACAQGLREMRDIARKQAAIELARDTVEAQVNERTLELSMTAAALRESEGRTREALEVADAANRAKSEFLANMSHEIRTPMTAILGYSELLTDPAQSPADRADCVSVVRRNAEHLLSLINDILDLSKIEAGHMTVENIECDPVQVCHEVYSLMQVKAKAKGIQLVIECPGEPFWVISDPTRLRQIILNLVGNAIKFTERGSVTLCATIEPLPEDRCTLRFDVRDTGIGMTPEQVGKLFAPFTQADTSVTRRFGGTGLGLMLSRKFATLLGGEVSLRSAAGEGSTFTLELPAPVIRRTAGAPAVRPRKPQFELPGRLSGRVLLAEDGPDNQRLISFHLRKAGVEVEVADNGLMAVQKALDSAAGGRPFGLILMDMQMPELDGYSATARLKSKGWSGPIIALTAHAMSGDRERCIAAGCDDYLTKPIDRAKLLTTCDRWLRQASAPARAA